MKIHHANPQEPHLGNVIARGLAPDKYVVALIAILLGVTACGLTRRNDGSSSGELLKPPVCLVDLADKGCAIEHAKVLARKYFISNGCFADERNALSVGVVEIVNKEEMNGYLDRAGYGENRERFYSLLNKGKAIAFQNEGDQWYVLFFDKSDKMYGVWG